MKKLFLIWLSLCLIQHSIVHAMEVAFEEDASLPLVYINVAVKGGAVDDPAGQLGISNFMAEMLLRGSKSRTKEQIDLELDQLGARLEVEARAEAIILRGSVLSTQLEPYLRLISEMITQPVFPAHEIRKLKNEINSHILEELGKDSSLASRRATQFFFQEHPYGNPVIGVAKDVERFTQEAVLSHYDRMFRDKKLLVVGAGDAKSERIKKWSEELARLRPGGVEPTRVPLPQESNSRRLLLVDKPERTQTQIHVGQMGLRMTDPDFFPLYLANHAFGGRSFSARMMVEIRVKRGWSYGAYSYFRFGRQPRSWQFHLFPAAKDTAEALGYSLKMVEDLKNNGITLDEFNFAKESLVNGVGFMFNTPQKRVENKLLERTLDLPDGFMKKYGPELEKVSMQDTQASLKRFIKPDRLSILVLGTAKDLKDSLVKQADVANNEVQVIPYTVE